MKILSAPLPWLAGCLASVLVLLNPSPSHADLVARWSFDEGSGLTAADSKGAVSGVLSASGASFVAGGASGGALKLDRNSGGFVSMGQNFAFPTGSFSISVWVKTEINDVRDDLVVFSKHNAGFLNGYWLNVNRTGVLGAVNRAQFYQGTVSANPLSTSAVNDGNWHHIVTVYDPAKNTCIYVDGIPSESCFKSVPLVANNAPFILGAFSTPGGGRLGGYNGLLDELAIYDQALGDSEIQFLYEHPGDGVPNLISILPEETFFTNKLSVVLTSELGVGQILYTTNGNAVTSSSAPYTGPFEITNRSVIKAAAFLNGFVISTTYSKVYERVFALDDGVSNDWRLQYFGAGYRTDPRVGAHEDPDHDGLDNLSEMLTGTDPLDPRSAFKASSKSVPQITFPSVTGKTYRIWRKRELGTPEAALAGQVVAAGAQTSFVDSAADGRVNYYYFVELVP